MASDKTCGVVVIGGGSAAFEAAIAAAEAGAGKVILVEKAPEREFGGNARFSHTGFRFPIAGQDEAKELIGEIDDATLSEYHFVPYTEGDFTTDLQRVSEGRIDPVLAGFMVRNANAAVRWLREHGVPWQLENSIKLNGKRYFARGMYIHPVGGGVGLLEALRKAALRLGVECAYDSRVVRIHQGNRRVTGVRVSARDGEYDIRADAVIVCSGGFQASAEMRARYLGTNADLMKVRGSKHNTGEVLQMLLALGAKSAGQWQGCHMSPIDGRAPDMETPTTAGGRTNAMNRYEYPQGITVNAFGERFFDEGENEVAYTYAKTGRRILTQPGGIAYQIFDQKGLSLFRDPKNPATFVQAETIEDLARELGMEPAVLAHTVEAFNAACTSDAPFDRSKLDGRSTSGITPRKSNWARPIDEGPFRAYPVTAGITFTFGGVQIDTDGRVIDVGLEPIEGLYASGDIVGLFYNNYPACSGQTRNVVFSRRAGRHAAERAVAAARAGAAATRPAARRA